MDFQEIQNRFERLGIDVSKPGFYDDPAFLAEEAKNPRFLELYAHYVDFRPLDDVYVSKVRQVVPALAGFVFEQLCAEGREGACIDVSGLLMRALDLEGIWSYSVGGGASVCFPEASRLAPSHFAPLGGESRTAAHVWVKVPPFDILDATLTFQPWGPERRQFFSGFVLAENCERVAPIVERLVDLDLIEHFERTYGREPSLAEVYRGYPHIQKFVTEFPGYALSFNGLKLAYTPTKISAVMENLEAMDNPILNGMNPLTLYQEYKKSSPSPAIV